MAITGIGSNYNSGVYESAYAAKSNEINKTGAEEQTRRTGKDEWSYLSEKYECLKSSDYSVNINSSLLAKATSDKKVSEWLEYNLSLIPKAVDDLKSAAAARGAKMISCHITMNGYDSMTTEVVTQAEADPGTEKVRKELEEKIRERNEEKKENIGSAKDSNVTASTVELKTSKGGTKTEQIKTGYSNVNDYSKYLQEKYSYMNTGTTSMQGVPTTVSVSSAFLKKCMNDPEKAKYLEENLAALPDCVKSLCNAVKMAPGSPVVTYAAYKIDDNGNISMMSGSTNDPDGKIAKENAKRKAQEKKAAEEKSTKRRSEKKAAEEAGKETGTYTVRATGTDIKTITQKVIAASLDIAAEVETNSKDRVQAYYEQLCKKFPRIHFNTNGGALPSNSSGVTVNLSYDCLKKMANDPEFAKEIEWNLSGEVAANSMVYGWAKRDGVVLGGRTVTYDANGNRQSSCGGMRTANTGNGNTDKIQKKYREEEERLFKTRKKREEKEKIAKRQAEKKAEKEEATERLAERKEKMEELTEETYKVSATGTDVKSVTQTIVAVVSGSSSPTGGSFDIKA